MDTNINRKFRSHPCLEIELYPHTQPLPPSSVLDQRFRTVSHVALRAYQKTLRLPGLLLIFNYHNVNHLVFF